MNLVERTVVKGEVIAVESEGAYVDIGYKMEIFVRWIVKLSATLSQNGPHMVFGS